MLAAIALCALPWVGGCRSTLAAPDLAGAASRLTSPLAAAQGATKSGEAERLAAAAALLQSDDEQEQWYGALKLFAGYAGAEKNDADRWLSPVRERLATGAPAQKLTVLKAAEKFQSLEGVTLTVDRVDGLLALARPLFRSPNKEVFEGALSAVEAVLASGLTRDAFAASARNLVDALASDRGDGQPPVPSDLTVAVRLITRLQPRTEPELKRQIQALLGVAGSIFHAMRPRGKRERYQEVNAIVLEALRDRTGRDFGSYYTANFWWGRNKEVAPFVWYERQLRRNERTSQTYRDAGHDWWRRYVAVIRADSDKLIEVIEESLRSVVPEVRRDAVGEVARLLAREPARAEPLYALLAAALGAEQPVEVLQAILALIAEQPPETGPQRTQLGATLGEVLKGATHRETRLSAIKAAWRLGPDAVEARGALLDLLKAEAPDGEVVVAALQALSRIGAAGEPGVLAGVNTFLGREAARDSHDPIRNTEFVTAAIAAIGAMPGIEPGWVEARESVRLLLTLLRFEDKELGAKIRERAATAIGGFGHPAALEALDVDGEPRFLLFEALADTSSYVAISAAEAIGRIATHEGASAAGRAQAIAALEETIDREGIGERALDQLVRVALADPAAGLAALRRLAGVLAARAGDPAGFTRMRRLFVGLDKVDAAMVDAEVLSDLRQWQAEALLKGQPADPAAARDLLEKLPAEGSGAIGPRGQEIWADSLVALRQDVHKADALYAELIGAAADPVQVTRLWRRRVAVIEALLAEGRESDAKALIARHLDQTDLPPDVRADLEGLRKHESEIPEPDGPASRPPADTGETP